MIGFLTAAIGLIAKGKAAKAIAGSVSGIITTPVVAPLAHEFIAGILDGAGPEVRQAGALIGAAIATAIVNYALVWLAPKNAPPPNNE